MTRIIPGNPSTFPIENVEPTFNRKTEISNCSFFKGSIREIYTRTLRNKIFEQEVATDTKFNEQRLHGVCQICGT